jgi:DNA-binding NtrC family response regulator
MPLSIFPSATLATLPLTIPRRPTILLVDDDTGIRRFLYSVVRRATPADVIDVPDTLGALQAMGSLRSGPDLLITDVDLGSGPNGLHLATAVARASRSTRIVLMSGNPAHRKSLEPRWRFLAKPFTIEAFVGLLKESLAAL